MSLLIAVPSKARPEALLKNTWAWLQHLPYDKRIFVEPQDREAYCRAGLEQWLHVLPENDRGLGYALSQVAIAAQPYEFVFKMDDDVKSFSRGHGDPESVEYSTGLIQAALEMHILPTMAAHADFAAVTFDYLQFHRINPDPNKLWVFYSRLRSIYVLKREWFAPCPEISALEDVYATTHIWATGGKTACYVPIAQRTNLYSLPGGHQADGKRAQHNQREAGIVHERYPLTELKKGIPDLTRWGRELRKAAKGISV